MTKRQTEGSTDLEEMKKFALQKILKMDARFVRALNKLEGIDAPDEQIDALKAAQDALGAAAAEIFKVGDRIAKYREGLGPRDGALDIAAAEEEILGRLARLRERG